MDDAVLKRILNRKKTGDKKDGYKIGLVFEGGGMRGVFGGGVARGLTEMGLDNAFDIVYGTSSGSCAAAYFLSGETARGDSIYYEDLNNFKFIKPWRLSKLMDIDYLGDKFRNGDKSLNTKAIKSNETLLKIYVSDADTGAHKCFTNRDKVDLVALITASCAAPGFYNKPVKIDGEAYLDGNVEMKLPIDAAIEDGCTDILVISSVGHKHRRHKDVLDTLRKYILMKGLSHTFHKAHEGRLVRYNENLDVAFGRKKLDNINIYTIFPKEMISFAETSAVKLKAQSENGRRKVVNAFRKAMS